MTDMDASAAAFFSVIEAGDFNALTKLIEAGGNVNVRDDDVTPLLFATRMHAYDLAEYLLKQGADVHARDLWGYTMLEFALSAESPRLLTLALNYGASVDAKALNVAWLLLAKTEHVLLMQGLLRQGANSAVSIPKGFLCKLGE
jgi:uncharacterized protein